MIDISYEEVHGLNAAIRGMRNPLDSWSKSDTEIVDNDYYCGDVKTHTTKCVNVGEKDLELMKKLTNAGTDHRKFLRMITVSCNILAPLYWWKEYDTYKVGTVANSCSTMHTICNKEFSVDDFSNEHLKTFTEIDFSHERHEYDCKKWLATTVNQLNWLREMYLQTKHKDFWWQIIQLLPSSYNQKRTVLLNYEVLMNMYRSRKNHKLDEWRQFCEWIETLPYMRELLGVE